MGTIKKCKGTESISRDLIFDNELSDRARFVYCYMMAKPDNWNFLMANMAKELGYSIETLRKYINELVERGWLERGEQSRNDDNQWGAVSYTIYEVRRQEKAVAENFRDGKNPTHKDKDYEERKRKEKENLIKESEIVDFWNENTEDYPKVKKVSDKVKKAIKARLNEGYSVEEIKCAILLMNTLGDFYKGRGDSHWKADFLWLMQNTKGNFEKILAGGLHVTAVQKHQYEIVMASQGKVDDDEYHPIYDDKSEIQFDKKANHYRLIGKDPRFSRVYDGYNDDTRPDGAILLTQYGKMKWSSESKEWDEIR